MGKTAAELKAELKTLRQQQETALAQYPDGNMPDSVAEDIRSADKQIAEMLAEYSERAQDEQRATSNREAMSQIFGTNRAPSEPISDQPKGQREDVTGTLGQRFTNNPEFKAWHQSITHGGRISENVPVKSPVVSLDSQPALNAALVTGLSSTSAGALVIAQRLPGITPLERDMITVLDLITRIPITSDSYEFVQVTTETNAAAGVLEATSTSNGAKPESAVAMAVVSGIVETIAHWIPLTRRAASDASQIMAYLDDFMRWGLQDTLADQVLNGDGNTPNLVGLASTSNTQSQAWDTDVLTTTRKARTLVRTVGKGIPNAYLMNPTDWETIDLLQDNEARYFFGGPSQVGMPVLWGLPVVEEERQASGTAWVADWREGLLFDREQTAVYMTDSHSDFFIRNILVLLAELRAAFGVRRPKTFVEIDMTA